MMFKLPKPHPNLEEYNKIMNEGFLRFPERRENYQKYLKYAHEVGKEVIDCIPVKMDYEVSTKCNFRCTMCAMSEIGSHRPPNMTFDDYKKTIDEQYGLVEVKLQGIGEPLLNTEFFKMVNYAVERNIWVRTTTNASLLHLNDNYKRMIDSKINEIQISVDGATKETFEKIRRGSNFERVVENCKMLNEYAAAKGEQWRTSCWMLVQKDNLHEVETLLELAAYMKFTRLTYSIAIHNFGMGELVESSVKIDVKNAFSDDLIEKLVQRGKELGVEVTFWDNKDKFTYTAQHNQLCPWVFGRAYITGDMRILPCCVICGSRQFDMGDARNFTEEWHNQKYRRFRERHLSGDIPEECRNCYSQGSEK